MEDKSVVITGASRGIGAAVAEAFGERGARVVVCAREESRLDDTVAAVEAAGGTAVPVAADVRDPDQVFYLFADNVEEADVVVANAGISPGTPGDAPLPETEYGEFEAAMATNVEGVFATLREGLPFLAADGRMLVPSGSVAREPTEGMGAYAVSKAGAEAVVRGFAADADRPAGVVDPGYVATGLTGGKGRDPADVAGLFVWAATACPAEDLDGGVVSLKDWKTATR